MSTSSVIAPCLARFYRIFQGSSLFFEVHLCETSFLVSRGRRVFEIHFCEPRSSFRGGDAFVRFISANLVPRFVWRIVFEVHLCEPRSLFREGDAFLKFISAWCLWYMMDEMYCENFDFPFDVLGD